MKHARRIVSSAIGWVICLAGCGGQTVDTPENAGGQESAALAPLRAAAATPAPPPATDAPRVAVTGEEFAELRRQVAQLQRDVKEVRLHLARNPAPANAAPMPPPDPRIDADARAEAQRAEEARLSVAETAFRREDVDARWSQGAAASVRAAFADADESIRNQVRSVECRASSCRIEISSDSQGRLGSELPAILGRLGANMTNMTAGEVDQGDGRQATVLYVAR